MLFNLSRLRAKSKVQQKCMHNFLFADDATITTHSAVDLQRLLKVYRACILSTLLYGNESWALLARQEHKLNTFHLLCL
jgi:hypothetical protein